MRGVDMQVGWLIVAARRFIPTCVGSMIVEFVCKIQHRFIPTCVGSMQFLRIAKAPLIRFIPTCVGSMMNEQKLYSGYTVHPHMRGVDYSIFLYDIP